MLRTILRAIGLPDEAIDDIVDRIVAFLSPAAETSAGASRFPYALRDDFLSPAERSFCMVLRGVVTDQVMVCPKVALGDLFYASTGDPRQNRIATNRIDRKHVDFLLCDPKTLRPLVGIELDDKSHQRPDRQERDEFVGGVFAAAKLPLVRVPVQHAYSASELKMLLQRYLPLASPAPAAPQPVAAEIVPVQRPLPPSGTRSVAPPAVQSPVGQTCPKCGSAMVLRTAKSGANQGGKFWGCPNFPRCRGVMDFKEPPVAR